MHNAGMDPFAPPSRREFLLGAGAAAALPLACSSAAPPAVSSEKKKVLVLGGTAFLGPAVVRALLAAGHEVTLFNRGRTNPEMFPGVEKLRGQRRRQEFGARSPQDLTALEGRSWDAVVDTSAYWTKNVEDMVALLRDRCGQYVFISTISVYEDLDKNSATLDEDSPVGTLDDKYVARITEQAYGPLKAYCEQAVRDAFCDRATVIRPGYIVGRGDPYDRLTSRVERLGRGGETLAPGNQRAELQMIDVRDLGAFTAKCAAEGVSGTFNATGFEARITTEEFHHAAKCTLNHRTRFVWCSDDFLENRGIRPWGDLACWTPDHRRNYVKVERAVEAGLEFTPLTETIRDTWEWSQEVLRERALYMGLSAERERDLLKEWRAQK